MNLEDESKNQPNNKNDNSHNTELDSIYLHEWIDCCDEYNKWYEAQIIDISVSSSRHIKVHYKGWKSKFDTWIDLDTASDAKRVCALHEHTIKPTVLGTLTKYDIGTKCDCLDSTDKWYQASIVEISANNKLLRIHYNDWDSKYDEWLNTDSYRIAPLHTMTTPKTAKKKPANNTTATVIRKPKYNSNTDNNNDYKKIEEHSNDTDTSQNIKNITNPNTDTANDNDQISQQQRDKNREIQKKYLSHFKPSERDEQQFALKLQRKGLHIESMGEDGNCLFRSISHQVYGKQDFHNLLRAKCVLYLQSEYEYFGSYVPGGHDKDVFDAYCVRMSHNGIWGDNLEIQAFSEIYGRSIEIYAYDDKPMKTFTLSNNNNANDKLHKLPPIRLSYHCNSHYNSIMNNNEQDIYMINGDKVGEIEDDKIRLSYLRSTHASQATLAISDMEATELEYFNIALAESRKMFTGNDENNQQFDIAIEKSLAQFEKESVDEAIKKSLNEQENMDLAIALKKSQYDFCNFNQNVDQNNNNLNNENQNNFHNNFNFNNNNNNFNNQIHENVYDNMHESGTQNNAIQIVVDRGYSLEQATLAFSVFEAQQNEIPPQTFIQRMIDYIENTEKATMFGYMR